MIVGGIAKTFYLQGISGDLTWQCITDVFVSNYAANRLQVAAQGAATIGAVMTTTWLPLHSLVEPCSCVN